MKKSLNISKIYVSFQYYDDDDVFNKREKYRKISEY